MRHTGDWLPDLPAGWAKGALRWQANVYSGGTPARDVAAYWIDGTIPWLASGAVNQWVITEPSDFITERGLSESSAQWVPADAVVMGLAGQGKTKGMVARTGIRAACNQSMCAIVPEAACLEHRFLHFWLSVNHDNIRNLAGGDKRDGLNHEHVRSIVVPLPPVSEQRRIADYLDQETAEIDAMDADLDRLVEALRERRATVVERALSDYPRVPLQFGWEVTDCLHKTAQFVDEGEHYVVSIGQLDGRQVDVSNALRTTSQDFNILRSGGRAPKPGDAVMSRNASVGKLAVVTEQTPEFALGQDVVLLRPLGGESAPLLAYCMESATNQAALELAMIGTTFKRINVAAIKRLPWAYVTSEEQHRILAELDESTSRIDEMIADATRLKALLVERRSTLITDVVIGVKEVPA